MVRVYILMKIEPNQLMNVINGLQRIKSVKHFDVVTGPYDIIATAEVSHETVLSKLVSEKVSEIEGVKETLPCHILTLEV